MGHRLISFLFLLFAAMPARAVDLDWRSFDLLPEGEKALAQSALFDMFGDNPEQWPDWIEPAALWVPIKGDFLLVARWPRREACGQFGYAIFGPVTAQGGRDKLGEFCAGSLDILRTDAQDWPDFDFREGRSSEDGVTWQRLDQILRYRDGQWWRVLPKPAASQ